MGEEGKTEEVDELDYSNMSKAKRKKLKRERREHELKKERHERQKKQRIKGIRNYGIIILIVLGVIGSFYWKSIPPKNAPIIELFPTVYNFGTVSQAKGIVTGTMKIVNRGNEDLIINNMDSSCGCTSAAIVYNGKEGPRFSMAMHGTNPKNWKQIIPPGGSAELKVYYDPNVHKDLKGSVTRSITVFSNDPRHRITEVKIIANQVD